MSQLPSDLSIEILVPVAKTEQEFLRLVVQAAVLKYPETRRTTPALSQAPCTESSLHERV